MTTARRLAILSVVVLALVAPAGSVRAALSLSRIANGYTFESPVYLTHAGDERLFVVELKGDIEIIHSNGTVTKFLDLSSRVSQSGGERGLLGLAFHPSYASNGLFYVFYTRASDGDIIVAEYRRSTANANTGNFNSERVVMRIEHSAESNHNGGWMAFKGSSLYIATGDGGGGGDPFENGQDRSSLLGKILRINPLDPDGSGSRRYSIPSTNPYVGSSGLDEVWSYGLRNPWRCSFDRGNGNMWCADVGQNKWEEINRHRSGKGVNYGWDVMEGRVCYEPASGCNTSGKRLPIAVYSHSHGCSVTGGYVSRRSGAALYGKYVFGDYCTGIVWAIPQSFSGSFSPTSSTYRLKDTSHNISSFGEDVAGRLYLVDLNGGVYRLNDS
jgi:glucose/arabinose dehydrogenase